MFANTATSNIMLTLADGSDFIMLLGEKISYLQMPKHHPIHAALFEPFSSTQQFLCRFLCSTVASASCPNLLSNITM